MARGAPDLTPAVGPFMCLILWIDAPAAERPRLEEIARSLPAGALRVEVERVPWWPWAKPRERVRATISESGGCACSLLADDADLYAPYWSMRPEALAPLANTVEHLAASGPGGFGLRALWVSDDVEREEGLSVPEMLAVLRAGRLGTRTRYLVGHPPDRQPPPRRAGG